MRRVFADASYASASHAIAGLSQFLLQVYVVRSSPLAAYGRYALTLSAMTIIYTVFFSRSGELALQFVGRYWVSGDYARARAVANRIIRQDVLINWSVYGVILLGTILLALAGSRQPYLAGLGLLLPAYIGYGVYKAVFITAAKIREQAIFEIIYSLLQLVSGIIGTYFFGIGGLIASQVLTAWTYQRLLASTVGRWWPTKSPVDYAVAEVGWRRFSLHSLLRNGFSTAGSQIDLLILGAAAGAEVVAIYRVAKSLATLPARISAPVWATMRPRLIRRWHTAGREGFTRLVFIPAAGFLAALVMAVPLARLFLDEFIATIYGSSYAAAAFPCFLLFVGNWLFGAVTGWFNFVVVIGEEKLSGTLAYGALFFMILVGGILYGHRSAQAMAWTVAVALAVVTMMAWSILLWKLRPGVELQEAEPPATADTI